MDHIGYGRVSELDFSRKIENDDLDVAANQQKRRLERAGCEKIYFDVQRGTDDDRPEFEKIMDLVRRTQVKRVTITRDDRITRSISTTLKILEAFLSTGVELVILEEGERPVDLNNPYEWKRRVSAGLDAQFEVKMLGLRIRRGYEDLRSQGRANPHPPFGYIRSRKGLYEPHSIDYDIAKQIVEYFVECREVAKTLQFIRETFGQTWRRSRFSNWIKSEVLRGNTPYKVDRTNGKPTEIIYGTHSNIALISTEQSIAIEGIFTENKRLWGSNKNARRYLLGGLCRCSRCNSTMACRRKTVGAYPENYYYLDCCNLRDKLCDMNHSPSCRLIESRIIDKLIEKSHEIAEISLVPKIKEESPQLRELRRQLSGVIGLGKNPAIEAAKEDLLKQIHRLENEEESSDWSYPKSRLLEYGKVTQERAFWEEMNESTKRELFEILVDFVTVDGSKTPGIRQVNYRIEVFLTF